MWLVCWYDSQTVKPRHLKGMNHSGVFGVFMLLCNPRHYHIPCLLQLQVTWYLFLVPAHFPLLSSQPATHLLSLARTFPAENLCNRAVQYCNLSSVPVYPPPQEAMNLHTWFFSFSMVFSRLTMG